MATLNTGGKTAYVYDLDTDTWFAIAGNTNTVANYVWTGTHEFQNNVTLSDINSVLIAKGGVNNFLNETTRDAAMTSPVRGTVCFIRQDSSANNIDQLQYYDGTAWRPYEGVLTISAQVAASDTTITLGLSDLGKTITLDSTSNYTISIPANSTTAFPVGSQIDFIRLNIGSVTFAGAVGVTINSKNSNKKIAARYTGASIVKIDTNTWILVGDLIA